MIPTQEIKAENMSNIPVIYKLCRMAKIMETVNNEVVWRLDNSKVSPGFLIESLVISTLSCRKPLWKMHEFWTQSELDFYYSELGLKTEWLNDDAYGRALDKLSETRMQTLISQICLEMIKLHDIDLTSVHLDTTSKSVQGVFEGDAAGEFDIVHGYSKDHRPDLKQYKIGAAVQQNGLPVMGDLLAGNKADNQWNPEAIHKMRNMFEGHGFKDVIFIGDSATVSSYESLRKLRHIRFISRLPETFAIAAELKAQAFTEDRFVDVRPPATKKKASEYSIASFLRKLDGTTYRFVVVRSTALQARKAATQEKSIAKKQVALEKQAKKLHKQSFACEADALSALEDFKKLVASMDFLCTSEVQVERNAAYAKRGRPKASDVATINEVFHAHSTIIGPDEETFTKKLQADATFILISSILDTEKISDVQLLEEYKHQNSIEAAFRFLKSPVYLGQTLLNRKGRVEAMGYVFILVLMIACYLQYRVRKSLEDRDEYVLDPGNKKNRRPSIKRIFEILEDVVVLVTPQGRFFPANTNPRIFKMIEWAGFEPEIYLKN